MSGQILSFLRARLARDASPLIESSSAELGLSVGRTLISQSELSYEQRVLRAHRIAAEVRHRKGWDRYYNGAPKRDLDGRVVP